MGAGLRALDLGERSLGLSHSHMAIGCPCEFGEVMNFRRDTSAHNLR